jgi:hypothetical protein
VKVKSFEMPRDREFLMQRMGDLSQVAGLRRSVLADGKAQGVEAVDVRTGGGLAFTILPGRGLDLAWAEFRGVPLAYLSKTGVTSPSYYEPNGVQWLRSFFAGLMTTCGLSNVGAPCAEEEPVLGLQQQGLHGRISNMAADNVCVREEWRDGRLVMSVSGRLREAMLHGENLTLRREISVVLGDNHFSLCDVVENEGFRERPLMLLYHINVGYPILDERSRLICSALDVTPASELAKSELERRCQMGSPERGAMERVYFHDLAPGGDGRVGAALVNEALELGLYVKWSKRQLPCFTQWKQLGMGEYVVGLEPGNCWPIGRTEQRKRGSLEIIKPGEQRRFELEIGVLPDREAIARFEHSVGPSDGRGKI